MEAYGEDFCLLDDWHAEQFSSEERIMEGRGHSIKSPYYASREPEKGEAQRVDSLQRIIG